LEQYIDLLILWFSEKEYFASQPLNAFKSLNSNVPQ
jgi:hypothetical protein